eukprot:1146276-Pelagomonas_calceolata.AAC.3
MPMASCAGQGYRNGSFEESNTSTPKEFEGHKRNLTGKVQTTRYGAKEMSFGPYLVLTAPEANVPHLP